MLRCCSGPQVVHPNVPPFCRRLSAIMGVYGSPTGLDVSKQSWTPQSRISKNTWVTWLPQMGPPVLIGVFFHLVLEGCFVSPPKNRGHSQVPGTYDVLPMKIEHYGPVDSKLKTLKNLSWWMMFFLVQEWPVESLSQKSFFQGLPRILLGCPRKIVNGWDIQVCAANSGWTMIIWAFRSEVWSFIELWSTVWREGTDGSPQMTNINLNNLESREVVERCFKK